MPKSTPVNNVITKGVTVIIGVWRSAGTAASENTGPGSVRCFGRTGSRLNMKDIESTAVGRAPEPAEGFANRKLIRPTLNRSETRADGERRERPERAAPAKKVPPAEQTHAENFYYQKQMQAKTPMVIVLQDGDSMEGVIEWYDKSCIKINRTGQPNVLIYKAAIKYMFKASEERR